MSLQTMQWLRRKAATTGAILLAASFIAVPAVASADTAMPISYHAWNSLGDFYQGQFSDAHVQFDRGRAALALHADATSGTWISNTFTTPTPVSKIVASWQADTPDGTWIETDLSVKVNGAWSDWFTMGKWTLGDTIQRTTVAGQNNDFGAVYQDTYFANDNKPASAYRLREQLFSTRAGMTPQITQAAVTASQPTAVNLTASQTTMHRTVDLNVPMYSQYEHDGEYPQYDSGGEAWCNPTSTEMVVEYYGKKPTAAQIAALPADPVFDAHNRADGSVDYAVVHTYDYGHADTGNWPFQTAYAASYGLKGSVRQADSLRTLEWLVKQGIPTVIATAWNNTDSNPNNDLTGASIPKTDGHLMVVRGFTADGDVIANDPASPDDASVRHVYQRAQFERDWLNVSDGTYYLITR